MTNTGKVAISITIAVLWFLATALIDAWITVWIFKKYGGCPIHHKLKPKEAI